MGEDIGGAIERYDPSNDAWTVVAKMEEPRFSMGIVVYQAKIYMMGGCTHSRRHMQELVSYNPVQIVLELEITSTDNACLQVTNEWTTLASMLVPRSQMGCVVLNEFLYVLGGTNRHNEVLQVGQQTSRGVIGTLRKF